MSTQPIIEPVTEEIKKARYEWQPTDEEGRPLGGKQVVEYTEGNLQEAVDAVAQNNVQLQRELRKVKRDQTLGVAPAADILPEGLEPLDEEIKPLTAEDRVRLTRDLSDPEKCDAAAERLYQSSPSYRKLSRDVKANRAFNEGRAFAAAHPEFHQCRENAEALMNWCLSRKPALAPTMKNFEVAFDKLKEAGLLLEAPIAAEETRANTQPEPDSGSRITSKEQEPIKRPVKASSGLTRDMGSSAPRTVQPKRGLTWAEVDRWSEGEYRAKMRDPETRKQIDALPSR